MSINDQPSRSCGALPALKISTYSSGSWRETTPSKKIHLIRTSGMAWGVGVALGGGPLVGVGVTCGGVGDGVGVAFTARVGDGTGVADEVAVADRMAGVDGVRVEVGVACGTGVGEATTGDVNGVGVGEGVARGIGVRVDLGVACGVALGGAATGVDDGVGFGVGVSSGAALGDLAAGVEGGFGVDMGVAGGAAVGDGVGVPDNVGVDTVTRGGDGDGTVFASDSGAAVIGRGWGSRSALFPSVPQEREISPRMAATQRPAANFVFTLDVSHT